MESYIVNILVVQFCTSNPCLTPNFTQESVEYNDDTVASYITKLYLYMQKHAVTMTSTCT